MPSARDDLLDRVVDDVARRGIGDRSLRELAAAVGTSHRMLLYHFGSREGLVAAIVARVEHDQREVLRALVVETRDPSELVRRLWRQVSAPELRPFVRLFFEAAAFPASPTPGGEDELTAPWLTVAAEVAATAGIAVDAAELRLGVAVTRGLLVDLLASDDLEGTTASLERFIAMWEQVRSVRGGDA